MCLKYRKNTESKNPKVVRTKNGRIMLLSIIKVINSKKIVCNSKKLKLINEREAKWIK